MKTSIYTAFMKNSNERNGMFSDTKIGALENLRLVSVEMDNKITRAKVNSKNEMHFIQLCNQAGITIEKQIRKVISSK